MSAVTKPHHSEVDDGEKHAGYFWLAVCVVGMISSLTMYGIVLEYVTSGGRKLHEWSFVFVTTSIYATTAYVARSLIGEKRTEISKYHMLTLSLTSIASTFTSVRSLRYVIYPVQVLFKSCKPVPVMAFNVLLGKKYKLTKYVNVMIITAGVALFMGGGNSTQNTSGSGGMDADTTLMGAAMLSVSLCFDGATGAYEDKLMGKDHVEPFDLMFNIQLGKAVISFCILVATNGLNEFISTLDSGGFSLILLGLTGALGQVFVFVTIAKFGALNCALIGLCRKMLSLILSFFLYGHTLNAFQTVGLGLSLTAMIANFYEKGGNKKAAAQAAVTAMDRKEALPQERQQLLAPDDDDDDEDHDYGDPDGSMHTVGLDLDSSSNTNKPGKITDNPVDVSLLDLEEEPVYTGEGGVSGAYSDLPEAMLPGGSNV